MKIVVATSKVMTAIHMLQHSSWEICFQQNLDVLMDTNTGDTLMVVDDQII
jgi:hypothetical protein